MDLNAYPRLDLARALRLINPGQYYSPHSLRLALTGGGGKSTALFQLARQLPPPVLVTASTHLAVSQLSQADHHFQIRSLEDLSALDKQHFDGVVLLTGPVDGAGRTLGLSEDLLDKLHHLAAQRGAPLLVEADGSRRRPLKAPAEHEPAIPAFTNLSISVVGLSGLGKPLDQASVHRPERFAALSKLEFGAPVIPAAVVQVLLHRLGGLKNIPAQARRVVLLNQADDPELVQVAGEMAPQLLGGYQAVLAASLGGATPTVHAVIEKTAGVILAAGGSSRLGRPKQLLDWHGAPLVRHVAGQALAAGLSPVVVVTGAKADQVRAALQGLPVSFAHNPAWESGQASSVQVGVRALPVECGAALFLLSDQPQTPTDLLRTLVQAHARTLSPLVAPRVHGQRANPVLFDAALFPELLMLSGDTGGRSLFSHPQRFPVQWIDWDDPDLLLDVDTPADYRRLQGMQIKS
jgi:molybdenum cofactor cytidylyltransferase